MVALGSLLEHVLLEPFVAQVERGEHLEQGHHAWQQSRRIGPVTVGVRALKPSARRWLQLIFRVLSQQHFLLVMRLGTAVTAGRLGQEVLGNVLARK